MVLLIVHVIDRIIVLFFVVILLLQENYNAFHLAVLYSREDTIKFLLAKKVDISTLAGVKFKLISICQ